MNRIKEIGATKLEDFPNELWLELLTYFTWFQLKSTWLQWQLNARILALVREAWKRVAFEISSDVITTYGECLHYFDHEHPRMAHRIRLLVFDECLLSSQLTTRWLKTGSSFLPGVRRFNIFADFIGKYVLYNIGRLIVQPTSTLCRLVLFFNGPDINYASVLEQLIRHRVSLPTMELIVVNDIQCCYFPHSDLNVLCSQYNHWSIFPRTVRLRLSLQHISELALLIQRVSLPRVKYLHITLEDTVGYLFERPGYLKIAPRFNLCPKDLHPSQADLPELRTLHLQQISMSDVLLLIEHFTSMVRLESLTLVHCNVKDRNELNAFIYGIRRYLLALRRLQFVLRFPPGTVIDKNSDVCWFNLVHCEVEEETNEGGDSSGLVLYTVPYPLVYCRQVRNHRFAQRSPVTMMGNHLCWTVDRDSQSPDESVARLKHVRFLHWNYAILVSDIHFSNSRSLFLVQDSNAHPCPWRMTLTVLRQVNLEFDESGMPISHRLFLLEQLRLRAPALECLTLWWHDTLHILSDADAPWVSIQQFFVRLRSKEQDDPSPLLVGRLASNNVFPRLQHLSFVGPRRFTLNPTIILAERILAWLDALLSSSSTFSSLHVNKDCFPYRTQPYTSRMTLQTLLQQQVRGNDQQNTPARVIIDSNEEILVWL